MALLQRRTVRATARRQADAQTIGVKLPRCAGRAAAAWRANAARRRAGLVLGRARQRVQQRIGVQGGVQQMLVPEFVLRKCCAFFFCVQSVCFLYR